MTYVVDPARPWLGGNIAGGDSRTHYPQLWAWLVSRFAITTVLDVGCGEGHACAELADIGCRVKGIDGLYQPVTWTGQYIYAQHDLTTSPHLTPQIDLVWCCEVVEHIEERFLANLLDTITQGRVLAMTHAVPGQGGWHHVNCQPADYWIDHVQSRGMRLDRDATNESRTLAGHYWQATGLIFTRGSA